MGWVGDIVQKEMLTSIERYLNYRDINQNYISSTITYLFSNTEYLLMKEKIKLASLFFDCLTTEDLSHEQYASITSPKSLIDNPELIFNSATPVYSVRTPIYGMDLSSTPRSVFSSKGDSLEHKNSSLSLLSMEENKNVKNIYSLDDTESQTYRADFEPLLQDTEETTFGTQISALSSWVDIKRKEVKIIRGKYNHHQPGVFDAILQAMYNGLKYLDALEQSCKFDRIIQQDNISDDYIAKAIKLHLNYLYVFAYDLALLRYHKISDNRKENFYLGSGIRGLEFDHILDVENKIQENLQELLNLHDAFNLSDEEQKVIFASMLDKFLTYMNKLSCVRPDFLEQCRELRISIQPIAFSNYNHNGMCHINLEQALPKAIQCFEDEQTQLDFEDFDSQGSAQKVSAAKLVG